MSNLIKDGAACVSPLLAAATTTVVKAPEWVSIVCTTLTTLVVCGIKIYRLIRDRNKDLNKKNKTEGGNKDE